MSNYDRNVKKKRRIINSRSLTVEMNHLKFTQ